MFAHQQSPKRDIDDVLAAAGLALPTRKPREKRKEAPKALHEASNDAYTKRSSLFSKRPKSSLTSSSNGSSTGSRASLSSQSDSAKRSQVIEPMPSLAEAESARSRFFLSRSKRSNNSCQKLQPSPENDDESEMRRKSSHPQRSSSIKGMKISAPFGFQHVSSVEQLDAEGGQSGDKVRELSTGNSAPPNRLMSDRTEEVNRRQRRPPPLRPPRPEDMLGAPFKSAPIASFRQPYRPATSDGTTPMVGSLSAPAVPPVPSFPLNMGPGLANIEYSKYASSQYSVESDDWDRLYPVEGLYLTRSMESNSSAMQGVSFESVSDFSRPPQFPQSLEKVPEEPEGNVSRRQSNDLARRPSLRHSKSTPEISRRVLTPILASSSSANVPPSPPAEDAHIRPVSQCSQGSDTLGNPDQAVWHAAGPAKSRTKSTYGKDTLAWEQDIDYCYEHNAEADCEFDWQDKSHFDDRDSDEEAWSGLDSPYTADMNSTNRTSGQNAAAATTTEEDYQSFAELQFGVPSKDSIPDLDYRYSHSTSTNSLTIPTPRERSLFLSTDSLSRQVPDQSPAGKEDTESEWEPTECLYDEIIIARNVDNSTPEIPPRSAARPRRLDSIDLSIHQRSLPTPPVSSGHSPVVSQTRHAVSASREMAINTIVAELRGLPLEDDAFMLRQAYNRPLPPSPTPSQSYSPTLSVTDSDDVPQLVPRNAIGIQNAAKQRLFDAQTRLSSLPPTSAPRSVSNESVVTTIAAPTLLGPPTPPKTPSVTSGRSFLSANSPPLPPLPHEKASLGPLPNLPSPLATPFTADDLPPLEQARSAPSHPDRPVLSRLRSGSAAPRLGVLPSPSSPMADRPETPRSVGPIPEETSPGRQSYSLFPASRKPPQPLDSRPVLNGINIPTGPRSAGLQGPPSSTRGTANGTRHFSYRSR